MPARQERLRLRSPGQEVTQGLIDRLPALLTAYEVKWITGLDDHELAAEVKGGRIKVWKRKVARKGCRGSYQKYVKSSVARLAGYRAS